MRATERDYVLGTHDHEIARLGIQHSVWRDRAMDAWRTAGIGPGQTIIDVGSGPGYAALDLAELVGDDGQVIAVDRSRRFLDALEAQVSARGLSNVSVVETDLDDASFEPDSADGAWCRWVLAFVMRPRELLGKVASAIKPGGVFVCHEYFNYASWRSMPPSASLHEFAEATIANWRRTGGEPDIGLYVPRWLEELGFTIESVRTIVDVITPGDAAWQWPASFMQTGIERLIELGALDPSRTDEIRAALTDIIESGNYRMVTPGVLEVIARRAEG